jgi:hypothetical protein
MDALELVLSAKLIQVDASETPTAVLFSHLLEIGAVFICRCQGSMFSPAITGASIVDVLASLPSQTELGPRGQAAKVLFQRTSNETIAYWWERCVDLTMVCRSLDLDEPRNVFRVGAVGLDTTTAPLTVRKATNAQDLKFANVNELVVPPPGHPGYDYRAMVVGGWFYNQMKIGQPKLPAARIRARVITSIIDEHSAFFPSDTDLSRVHISFYEWGNDGSDTPSQQDVLDSLASLKGKPVTIKYVQDHWQNIHTVTRSKLQDWLVLSIPRMATALYGVRNSQQ